MVLPLPSGDILTRYNREMFHALEHFSRAIIMMSCTRFSLSCRFHRRIGWPVARRANDRPIRAMTSANMRSIRCACRLFVRRWKMPTM
jgi:hypothetical protein